MKGLRLPSLLSLAEVGGPEDTDESSSSRCVLVSLLLSLSLFNSIFATPPAASSISNDEASDRGDATELLLDDLLLLLLLLLLPPLLRLDLDDREDLDDAAE